ncbi:MAG TPA: COX15/CtaA family protein [Candidatus Polarisedimenticolaceae bacterium]|nr:COX15/CtaA family protein [Candidatus Polarisedimenticolaceae bacterium]
MSQGTITDAAAPAIGGRLAGLPAVVTAGFATTVGMWAAGYLCRLPAILLPSPFVLVLLLACLFTGGLLLGRLSGGGATGGAAAGLVSAALNLLVLGSLLGGAEADRLVPSALWWIPGSILASTALGALGSAIGSARPVARAAPFNWLNAFVWVAVAATALLLAAGGLVTSAEAGLAVDDWPTSFGYNMFLYPFSKMTGGIYYEHAHRLLGALVGLTTVVLASFVQATEPRRWVRAWAWVGVPTVIVQGVLGGIRVTERNLALAMAHGVLAQLFFAGLVALAVFTSDRWRGPIEPTVRRGARTDLRLGPTLVAVTVVQLVLGASQRHFQQLLMAHLTLGLLVVLPLALAVGSRAWGLATGRDGLLRRLGRLLVAVVLVQVVLGFGALVVTLAGSDGAIGPASLLVFPTAHQWLGAVLLAVTTALVCWNSRCLDEPGAGRTG